MQCNIDTTRVHNVLCNFKGSEPLKRLFWTELNYDQMNQPLSTRDWSPELLSFVAEAPVLLASAGPDSEFNIIYIRLASDELFKVPERSLINKLLPMHQYSLFVFSNQSVNKWHFINVKYKEDPKKRPYFRRISVGPDERLRTAAERLALLNVELIEKDDTDLAPLAIQEYHDRAFDVEAVTKQFFQEYHENFEHLKNILVRQTKDLAWAHGYALNFLNRCMFLYFIQRKGWLGEKREFMHYFWKSYNESNQPVNTFVEKWLNVLFFEAFNNKFHGGHRQFPEEIRNAMMLAPYLNGGLFSKNDLDFKHNPIIKDKAFKDIFEFLERYNFTIAEETPIDQEVAVDPEMIGKVYESLVNVSEDVNERSDAGIFYTSRTEIDLMCRLSLVDNLSNHLGFQHRNLICQLVFAILPEDKKEADQAFASAGLWEPLEHYLRGITMLDPACGSGSFLVGMLHILDDLLKRAGETMLLKESAYERKKKIIGRSLYGVDVMEWACHVAELRLWLYLVIDAEFTREELNVRTDPLLPNFSFKIRCGDSLVQELGGMNMGHIRRSIGFPAKLKARITQLKNEKLKFYNNEPSRKFNNIEEVKKEEFNLFSNILGERCLKLKEDIKATQEYGQVVTQGQLFASEEEKTRQLNLLKIERNNKIALLEDELHKVTQALETLKSVNDVPFVWDISFVEIFEGENKGFDIVIGNPPYVRQENIVDPHTPRDQVNNSNKKDYKRKLARSVYQAFNHYFNYDYEKDKVEVKLNAKSDLYIYFYFHGLSLVNSKGSFCFITSNSWLDVDYGQTLQEFLLKHCKVKMVIDNQLTRSFSNADVNTVIVLLSSADDRQEYLNHVARFIMFQVPFEDIISSIIFNEIEEKIDRKVMPEYRLFPARQDWILQEGSETLEKLDDSKDGSQITTTVSESSIKVSSYKGDKWGGKYLRAPDIYWTILEKGKDKFVRLGDVAEVRRGITTGANEFFYLDAQRIKETGVEAEFLKPVIKSPRESRTIIINEDELKYKLFMCNKDKKILKGTVALEYIKWGESQKFHLRPSCNGRTKWWDVGERKKPSLFFNYLIYQSAVTYYSSPGCYCSDNFHEIHVSDESHASFFISLNSIMFQLMINVLGRSNFGGGLLKIQRYELSDLLCLNPDLVKVNPREIPDLNSEKINNHVFDILNLSKNERDSVYEAVDNLISNRLVKSTSL